MELPRIRLEVIEDLSPPATGFLRLRRRRYRVTYPDGSRSAAFEYDEVDRPALNAVVIIAHYSDESGQLKVFLRSGLRPPLAFRGRFGSLEPERLGEASLWELPAGLIEPAEQVQDHGARESARRELHEELGFDVPRERFRELGPSVYPLPGVIAERQFFFEVRVDPAARREPMLDGSALEHAGVVVAIPLLEALDMCKAGEIEDAKTELGLRRLAERLP